MTDLRKGAARSSLVRRSLARIVHCAQVSTATEAMEEKILTADDADRADKTIREIGVIRGQRIG